MTFLIIEFLKKYGLFFVCVIAFGVLIVQNKINKSKLVNCQNNNIVLTSQIEVQNQAALQMKKATDELNKKITITNKKIKTRFEEKHNDILALKDKNIGSSCDDAVSFLIDNK
jgi:hypothetical protein